MSAGPLAGRFFRALLRLLPEEFRSAHGRDMEATFRAEWREAGSGRARLWASTVVDLLRTAPAAHFEVLRGDLRFAARGMARRPLHTAVAVASLGLGLGAAVAMFAVVDAVLLAPLPYAESGRLVAIDEVSAGREPSRMGHATFQDLRRRARAYTRLVAAGQSSATLAGDGRDALRVSSMRVSAGYFEMLGAAPFLGRTFDARDDRPGPARQVVVLSHGLWQERFGGDPQAIGQPLDLSGTPFTVIGVMGPGFQDLVAQRAFAGARMWVPLGYDPAASYACRTCRHLGVFGQLAPGITAEAAERETSALLAALGREHPSEYSEPAARVIPLGERFLVPVRPVLLALLAGVVLLLLVACGSVANLLLLRAGERGHEIAVRAALGVTRGRLARQLVTESLLLASLGAVAGLLPASLALAALAQAGPADLPRLETVALDARAAAAGVVLVTACGLAFGLVPLRQLWRRDVTGRLHGAGRISESAGAWRVRAGLIAANVALAAVLLVGSGLLVGSLSRLLAVEPGFDNGPVLTARVVLGGTGSASGDTDAQIAATTRFYDEVLERVRALPGVEAAAGVTTLPLGGGVDGFGLHVSGQVHANPEDAPTADRFVVTPGYFATLRVPLLRGRVLDGGDGAQGQRVAVVNRRLADELFPGRDALGQELRLGPPDAPARTIVGVVGDVRHHGLDVPVGYQVYVPQAQWAWAETALTLVVRASGGRGRAPDPTALAGPLRDVVRAVDHRQPVSDVVRYEEIVARTLGTRRLAAALLTAFAVSALLLALVGLYGALGVVVERRRRELSLRVALGARWSAILSLVLGQGLRPVLVGLAAGLPLAALGSRLLGSLLFGLSPLDPQTFTASAGVLLTSAVLCCLGPAWRASRVDPATALRAE